MEAMGIVRSRDVISPSGVAGMAGPDSLIQTFGPNLTNDGVLARLFRARTPLRGAFYGTVAAVRTFGRAVRQTAKGHEE